MTIPRAVFTAAAAAVPPVPIEFPPHEAQRTSSHCPGSEGAGGTLVGLASVSRSFVDGVALFDKKASVIRMLKSPVSVRRSIGDDIQRPTVYSQQGWDRAALVAAGSAVISPLFLLGHLRIGLCPVIAARRSIAERFLEGLSSANA